MLEVRHISKSFMSVGKTTVALKDINLVVNDGEFVSLLGPSGSGKTTLLRIIDGLTAPDEGSVLLDGQEVSGVSEGMAFVFQDINLLPWRTVVGNVEIGLEARGVRKQQRRKQAMEMLSLVNLTDVAEAPTYTLSGGMQQRVGVARALAVRPKVLLMDEPFAHLDNFAKETLQEELSRLWEMLRMTVVFVTHDVDEAVLLSDRIALLKSYPGRIGEVLPVDLARPRSRTDIGALEYRRRILGDLGSWERTA